MKNINKLTLFSSLLLASSTLIAAPLTTSTGFVYPANMPHSKSTYYGFGKKSPDFGNLCHLADDYNKAEGSPVYATANGIVELVDPLFPYYGDSNGKPGGIMVIKHLTSSGEIFYALYGHIKKMAFERGDFVSRGQQIAQVGRYTSGGKNLSHLHFGINTEKASFHGYTPTTACTDYRGFVDPEKYMQNHYTAQESCKAVDNKINTTKNTIVNIPNVLLNDTDIDGDPLSLLSADSVSKKGVTITNNGDGTFIYTPIIDYVGADSFKYKITDKTGCEKQATVYINVARAVDDGQNDGENNNGGSGGGGSFNIFGIAGFLLLILTRLFTRRVKKGH